MLNINIKFFVKRHSHDITIDICRIEVANLIEVISYYIRHHPFRQECNIFSSFTRLDNHLVWHDILSYSFSGLCPLSQNVKILKTKAQIIFVNFHMCFLFVYLLHSFSFFLLFLFLIFVFFLSKCIWMSVTSSANI